MHQEQPQKQGVVTVNATTAVTVYCGQDYLTKLEQQKTVILWHDP